MIFGIPVWFFVTVAVCSLLIGVGLRHFIDRRKAREELRHREELKELKKQLKRDKKKARKAKK